jgi:hypothetical protein
MSRWARVASSVGTCIDRLYCLPRQLISAMARDAGCAIVRARVYVDFH